jgi:hypothetical protein
MVEALRYKPDGCTMALKFTQPLTKNKYQKIFLGVEHGWLIGLTT